VEVTDGMSGVCAVLCIIDGNAESIVEDVCVG
jgi:hypothetical protein